MESLSLGKKVQRIIILFILISIIIFLFLAIAVNFSGFVKSIRENSNSAFAQIMTFFVFFIPLVFFILATINFIRRKSWRLILKLTFIPILSLSFLIGALFLFFKPSKVIDGSVANGKYKEGQTVLSEKFIYLFRKPRIGDVIIFENIRTTRIGQIYDIKEEDAIRIYLVKHDQGDVSKLTKDRIISRVYWGLPFKEKSGLSKEVQELFKNENSQNKSCYIENAERMWDIQIPNSQDFTDLSLLENKNFIYAAKSGYQTNIYKRNIFNNSQTKIFDFTEHAMASNSGNFWEGLPPNVSLSSDKKLLAYTDKNGLNIYNLQDNNQTPLITKIGTQNIKNEEMPKWSLDEEGFKYTYALMRPLLSPDNQYVLFSESFFEGSSLGLINTQTKKYYGLDSNPFGGANVKWSPVEDIILVPETVGGYTYPGLFSAGPENFEEMKNISDNFNNFEKQKSMENFFGTIRKFNASFNVANFSPDGQKIVFIYNYDSVGETPKTKIENTVAITNKDGSKFDTLFDLDEINSAPFFSLDGNKIFFTTNRCNRIILSSYDFQSQEIEDLVILPVDYTYWNNAEWMKNGFLVMTGYKENAQKRLFIFDIGNRKIIYITPDFDKFTTFLGFTD